MPVSPLASIPIPAAGKRDRALGPEDVDRYLAALEKDPECHLFYALAAHGLRAGEALALQIDDIVIGAEALDGAAGVISVEKAIDTKSGALGSPKTATGRRSVPVFEGSPLVRALGGYVAKTGRAGGPLFAEKRTTYWCIKRRAETRFKRAGLDPTVTPHVFRHSAGSIWLRAGVAPTTVASWLGHSVSTLMTTYAHVIGGLAMTSETRRVNAFMAATITA